MSCVLGSQFGPKLHFNETAARKQELRLRAAGLSHKWLTEKQNAG